MTRPSRVVVLAEDKRHQSFIWQYLRPRYATREVRFESLPAGKGAGEQWVRLQYATNVEKYRSRAARAETALIVMVDADTGLVSERIRQLHDTLIKGGVQPLRPREKIAHLIPKRNIETWVLCLNGKAVTEEKNHRHDHDIDDEKIKEAAKAFTVWSRRNAHIPKHCLPSLKSAIPEVRKIEP